MKFAILFALVAAAIAEPIRDFNPLSPTGRLTGGVATFIEQIPHQVSVQAFGIHVCSGTIISDTWILTAAHCFLFPAGWYTIRSGTSVTNSGGVVSSIVNVVVHEQYRTNYWSIPTHDVAVVQVPRLALGLSQGSIAMYSAGQQLPVGTPVSITGWGALTEGATYPVVLQTVMMPIVATADCSWAYSYWGGVSEGQVCAGEIDLESRYCDGDTGGPVTVNGVLAAIVSWGSACGRPGYLGVYTEVSVYRAWITSKTGI